MDYEGPLLIILSGTIFFLSSMNFDWYMNMPRTRMLSERIGRSNTRLFHMGLSGIMLIVGILITAGII